MDILFRAKDKETNEWVYGSLITNYETDSFSIIDDKGETNPVIGDTVTQYIGLNEKESDEKLFIGDYLSLEARTFNERDTFWDSNLGQKMKEKEYDEIIVELVMEKWLEISFVCSFKKDGKFVTFDEYYEVQEEERESDGENAYVMKDTGLRFIRYLLLKGAVVKGNRFDNTIAHLELEKQL